MKLLQKKDTVLDLLQRCVAQSLLEIGNNPCGLLAYSTEPILIGIEVTVRVTQGQRQLCFESDQTVCQTTPKYSRPWSDINFWWLDQQLIVQIHVLLALNKFSVTDK